MQCLALNMESLSIITSPPPPRTPTPSRPPTGDVEIEAHEQFPLLTCIDNRPRSKQYVSIDVILFDAPSSGWLVQLRSVPRGRHLRVCRQRIPLRVFERSIGKELRKTYVTKIWPIVRYGQEIATLKMIFLLRRLLQRSIANLYVYANQIVWNRHRVNVL